MNKRQEKKIAILGATGHIGKNLVIELVKHPEYNITAFARDLKKLGDFLSIRDIEGKVAVKTFNEFPRGDYAVAVNCVGVGDPAKLKAIGYGIFKLTETYDDLVLDYLEIHPHTLYVNISSGAVYGTDFSLPAEETSSSQIQVNNIRESDYYRIAKINSESKHRARKWNHIIDLRCFSVFSRFIDLSARFFMSELILSAINKKEFVTSRNDMIRDFIHPADLVNLVDKCIVAHRLNDVFDVYSLKPVSKHEILSYFAEKYGLSYSYGDEISVANATGEKSIYYSNNRRARDVGYAPNYSSMQCIIEETDEIMKKILQNGP